jgi:hypothetical protein
MSKNSDSPIETFEQRAERMWRNHQIREKYKENRTSVHLMVNPDDINYVTKKVKVHVDPAPVGSVVVSKSRRLHGGFERKFIKELREMLDERKLVHLEMIRASLKYQRRRLMREKLRRLELSVAASEKRLAEAQNVTKSKDLFA